MKQYVSDCMFHTYWS